MKLVLSALFAMVIIAGVAVGAEKVSSPSTIVLTETNHVLLRGEVNSESINATLDKFAKLLNKRKDDSPIYLVLDTPGGSVMDGLRLHEFLKGYENIHTITINSYSMGAILVELVDGDRLIAESGVLMFHRMKAQLPGFTTTEQIKSRAGFYESIEKMIEDKVAERVGIDVAELHKLNDDELYLLGKQAVERNYADKVVSLKCDAKLLKKKVIETVRIMPFLPPVEIEVPACPLL